MYVEYFSYWKDVDTDKVYEVDENEGGWMSFLNDSSFNLVPITKEEYEKANKKDTYLYEDYQKKGDWNYE